MLKKITTMLMLTYSLITLNYGAANYAPYELGVQRAARTNSAEWANSIFYCVDPQNENRYALCYDERGNVFRFQNVPGDGRCADFALGIDREEFVKRVRGALVDGTFPDDSVTKTIATIFLDTFQDDKYEFLSHPTEKGNEISSEIELAAFLFGLNVEIYSPNWDSEPVGKSDSGKKVINHVKRVCSLSYGGPRPSVRLFHKGSGGLHYQFLYPVHSPSSWERDKIRLLEDALNAEKLADRERLCREIAQVQGKGLDSKEVNTPQPLTADEIERYAFLVLTGEANWEDPRLNKYLDVIIQKAEELR